jgi:hypothetical protein
MRASVVFGGSALPQCSQIGLSSSIVFSFRYGTSWPVLAVWSVQHLTVCDWSQARFQLDLQSEFLPVRHSSVDVHD